MFFHINNTDAIHKQKKLNWFLVTVGISLIFAFIHFENPLIKHNRIVLFLQRVNAN